MSDYMKELKDKGYDIPADAKDVLECYFGDDSYMTDNAVNDFSEKDFGNLEQIMDHMDGYLQPDMEHCYADVLGEVNKVMETANEGRFDLSTITVERGSGTDLNFYKDGIPFGTTHISIGINEEKYMNNEEHEAVMPGDYPASYINNGEADWEYFDKLGEAVAKERGRGQDEENYDDFVAAIDGISGLDEGLAQ